MFLYNPVGVRKYARTVLMGARFLDTAALFLALLASYPANAVYFTYIG